MTTDSTGGCGCGKVRYNITGPVRVTVNCHCDSCRKFNGTPYSTYCVVTQNILDIVEGQDQISTYSAWDGGKKHVCSACGSPLYNAHKRYPGVYMVYYGSLSQNNGINPQFNIYCEDKLPWVDSISTIKSFQQSIEK